MSKRNSTNYNETGRSNSKRLLRSLCMPAFIMVFMLLAVLGAAAQAPSNDDPCNAIPLTAEATCNFQTFTNADATATTGVDDPACTDYQGGDVWFTVVVPADGALNFDSQTGVILDGGMAIYSGTCDNLTEIDCDDDGSANGAMSYISATGLTPGSTIWIRFWEYGGNNNGTFGICVSIPPPPPPAPVNDDPCNATPLTVGSTCVFTTSTNEGATASAGVPAPGCASYQGGDVWFSVTVPAGGALNFDSQTGVVLDGGMAIYSGTCDNLTLIECDDDDSQNGAMSYISATGLTPGSTIWIRMWEYGNNNNGTFGICVSTPPPPPANDDPCNAIPITVTSTCNYATYTNLGATPSTGVPAPGCANYTGGDVWFSAVVPSGGALIFDTQTGDITDGGMAIYSGTCNSLTLISCNDDSSPNGFMPLIEAGGLTPGSTVWIRVWERGNDNNGTFGLCVTIPPPPPANDEPCNAINIPVGTVCSYTMGTNAGATGSAGVPAPGCANYSGGDVWYKVTVPAGGALQFETQAGTVTDGGMAIYSGTSCSALTLLACDDNSGAGDMPKIRNYTLTPGSTVWIRVWEYGNDVKGTFGICVTIPPPPGPGEICSLANAFCSSNTYVFPNNTDQPSLGSAGIYDCLLTTPNPVWYYMQVQNSGDMTIDISQVSCTGAGLDVDFALWGPFTSLGAGCTGLSASNVVDCSYSIFAQETAFIPNAQAGEFYVLLITNYSNNPGIISFSQTGGTGGTGTTNCSIVTPCNLNAANSGPVCIGDSVNLISSTLPCATYAWTGPNGFTSSLQNPTGVYPPTTPGIYTYTVTSTVGAAGTAVCIKTTDVIVNGQINIGNDTTLNICSVDSVNLTSLYNTTGYTSTWTLGGAAVANPSAVNVAGVYQLVVSSSGSCSDTALVTLNIAPRPVLGLDTALILCTGATANLTTLYNTTGFTSSWTFGGIAVANPSAAAVAGVYQLIATNTLGCADTALVNISIDTLTAGASSVNATCLQNGTITVAVSSGIPPYLYSGDGGTTFVGSNSFTRPTAATPYSIIVKDGNNCQAMVTSIVGFTYDLTLTGRTDTTICENKPVTLTTQSNATSYTWVPATYLSDASVASPVATPAVTTSYEVTAVAGPCTAKDTVIITVVANPIVSAGSDISIVKGEDGVIAGTVSNAVSFIWSPATYLNNTGTLNPVAVRPQENTTYTLTAVNSVGCSASDDVLVNVLPYCIKVKNAFTPNGDGVNDTWQVYDQSECLTNITVNVFNRYGSKVFESRNYRNDWRGTYNGNPLPGATYYYVLTFELINGRKVEVRGDVTILR